MAPEPTPLPLPASDSPVLWIMLGVVFVYILLVACAALRCNGDDARVGMVDVEALGMEEVVGGDGRRSEEEEEEEELPRYEEVETKPPGYEG